jgi:hypothetical protein
LDNLFWYFIIMTNYIGKSILVFWELWEILFNFLFLEIGICEENLLFFEKILFLDFEKLWRDYLMSQNLKLEIMSNIAIIYEILFLDFGSLEYVIWKLWEYF